MASLVTTTVTGTLDVSSDLTAGASNGFSYASSTRLLTITNSGNAGGINLATANVRIYFGGTRAIEGTPASASGNLTLGEGYSSGKVRLIAGSTEVTGALTGTTATFSGDVKAAQFYTSYDWTTRSGGINIGNQGLTTGAVSFYDGVLASSASIYRDSSSVFFVGARGGTPTTGICIATDGNVGIGITNPSSLLHVNGTANIVGALTGTSATFSGTVAINDRLNTSSAVGFNIAPVSNVAYNFGGGASSDDPWGIQFNIANTQSANRADLVTRYYFGGSHNTNGKDVTSIATTKIVEPNLTNVTGTITNAYNLIIGAAATEATNNYSLLCEGNATFGGALTGTSATFSGTLTSSASVGNGTSYDRIIIDAQTGNFGGLWIKSDWSSGSQSRIGFYGTSPTARGIGFITDGGTTTGICIATDGNVGIGITNPSSLLHVNGTANIVGALTGTSATFSGSVRAEDRFDLYHTDKVWQLKNVSGTFSLRNGNTGAVPISITSAGAATFSGALTGTTATFSGNCTLGDSTSADSHTINGALRVKPSSIGYLDFIRVNDYACRIRNPNGNLSLTGGSILFEYGASSDLRMKLFDSGGFAIGTTFTDTDPGANNVTMQGKVGIGTTAPSTPLEVYKNGTGTTFRLTQASTSQYAEMHFNTDTNAYIFKNSSGYTSYGGASSLNIYGDASTPIAFHPGAKTNAVFFATSGNVGIGATTPAKKLTVYDTTPVKMVLQNNSSGVGASDGFEFYLSGNNAGIHNYENGVINFATNNTNRMIISAAGAIQFNTYGSGTHTGTSAYKLSVDSSGNIIETSIGSGAVDGAGTANYVSKWTDGDTIGNSLIQDNGTTVSIGGAGHASYKFHVASGKARFDGTIVANVAETDTVSYAQMLASPLHFWGAYCSFRQATNHSLNIDVYNGGTVITPLTILQDGKVGIGTTAPGQKLEVNGNIKLAAVPSTTANAAVPILFRPAEGTISGDSVFTWNPAEDSLYVNGTVITANYIRSTGSNPMKLGSANGGVIMELTSTGKVGIGTDTASSILHVDSEMSLGQDGNNRSMLGYSNSTNRLYIGTRQSSTNYFDTVSVTSGKVGIGTVDPGSYKFVVSETSNGGGVYPIRAVNTGTAVGTSAAISFGYGAAAGGAALGIITAKLTNVNQSSSLTFQTLNAGSWNTGITMLADGNVGIGITNPGHLLAVNGTANIVGALTGTSATFSAAAVVRQGVYVGSFTTASALQFEAPNNGTSQIKFYDNNASEGCYIKSSGHTYGGKIHFGARWDDDEDKVTFDLAQNSAGAGYDVKVGIGYANPDYTLKVAGNCYVRDGITTAGALTAATGTFSGDINLSGSGSSQHITRYPTVSGWEPLIIRFKNGSGANAAGIKFQTANGSAAYTDRFVINTDSNTPDIYMQTNGGNVGIGTATPQQLLDIEGTADNADLTGLILYNNDWATGETGQSVSIQFTLNRNGTQKQAGKILVGKDDDFDDGGSADSNMQFYTTLSNTVTERMRIKSDGKVGIGTTAPEYLLDVYKNTNIQAFRAQASWDSASAPLALIKTTNNGNALLVESATTSNSREILDVKNSGGSVFTIKGDGNVGINETSPDGLLHLKVSSGALSTYYDGDGDKVLWFRTASGTAQSEWKVDATKTWITTRGTLPLKFGTNDTLALTIDGSTQAATFSGALTATSATFTGVITADAGLVLNDNDKIKLGTSGDLEIYHDGSNSYIRDVGTGSLVLTSPGFFLQNAAATENMIRAVEDGAVTLYHNGSAKLDTTSTGVTVTGALKTTTILDTNNSAGTNGQVLVSTGAAIDWKTLAEISGVDGTGTANYLSKWTDGDTIGNSIIYDDGTNVGISTNAPEEPFQVGPTSSWPISLGYNYPIIRFNSYYGGGNWRTHTTGFSSNLYLDGSNGKLFYLTAPSTTGGQAATMTTRFTIQQDGNVGIGITNPSSLLHVNGTANIVGALTGTTATFTTVTAALVGNATTSTNTTGNAATATILATARTIGGVSFNGSASINLPGVNSAGNQNTSGSSASCTGNAATATALATGRTMAMTGDVTWTSPSFNGSGNVTAAATIATDAVDIAMLSASGTASSSTFLRGDNQWATPSGSTPNNATITLSAGTGLTTGGAFTTNQSSNETITFNVAPPTTAGSGAVGIGTTAYSGERTISNSAVGTNAWDVGTPDYIASIDALPAGTWLIRCDCEVYYSTATARFAARIIGDSAMMVKQHPEPGNSGLAWNNAGNGSYDGAAHTWRYIACAGPQDGTTNSGYSPWRYMGWYYFTPLSMAGVVVTTQAGAVWFQLKDAYTTGSKTFKVRNAQLTAVKVTS
jgi:hypothetical protein